MMDEDDLCWPPWPRRLRSAPAPCRRPPRGLALRCFRIDTAPSAGVRARHCLKLKVYEITNPLNPDDAFANLYDEFVPICFVTEFANLPPINWHVMRKDDRFKCVNHLGELSVMLVETKKMLFMIWSILFSNWYWSCRWRRLVLREYFLQWV